MEHADATEKGMEIQFSYQLFVGSQQVAGWVKGR